MKRFRRIIAAVLLFANITEVLAAAVTPIPKGNYPHPELPQSLTLSTNQLGLEGPLNAGVNYSSLTGAYFTGQFLQLINDRMGYNILGEYGSDQYRINGTFGLEINPQTFFKVSAEQLGQRLPFSFSTGNVEELVKQNAVGARLQRDFDFLNVSLGGYFAKAPNKALAPIAFLSNGLNCNGFTPGFVCITERNIAGASSGGADFGMGTYFNHSRTYLEGRVYYDNVHYNTIYSSGSIYNKEGAGGSAYLEQLLTSNLKFSAGAAVRKIYDTYNVALSWMPLFSRVDSTEISVIAQHVESHNQTPNNDMVGLKLTFFADKNTYDTPPVYGLTNKPIVNSIASWVAQPAVKMEQVLAISEEYTHVAEMAISGISPNFGPLNGGNFVTISGVNFPPASMVRFGQSIATIISITTGAITVIAPPASQLGGVTVTVTTPEGQTTSSDNGYLYTNGIAPIITGESVTVGPAAGGTSVTVTGANFVVGDTTVSLGGVNLPPEAVTVNSPTSLTFITPSHPGSGSVTLMVVTPAGPSNLISDGFTYVGAPTIGVLTPNSGTPSGGSVVTMTGTNFVIGETTVTIDTTEIPASAVTVSSSTSLSFTTPLHSAGPVDVSVTTPGGSATLTDGFTYDGNAATVSSISPVFGTSGGGDTVTIIGTNFISGSTTVTIGGLAATNVMVNSGTSLTCTTPPHAAGNVNVNVTTPTGSSGYVPGGFTYVDAPTAITLTPNAGPTAGGTTVTLTGTNFVAGNTSITFGGTPIPASSVMVNSPFSLTFNTPPGQAAGTVVVTVTNAGGTSNPVPGGFTYEDVPAAGSLSPAFGPSGGGSTVTITGSNFVAGDTTVTIGGTTVPATVNSSSSLTFTTPAHDSGTVVVTVSTPGGSTTAIANGFTYEDAPTATAINPAFGPIVGGTSVTVTGTNFVSGDTTVTIGGITIPSSSITMNSASSLTFSTPAQSIAGNVAVTVSTSGGTSSAIPGGFTYEDIPTATSLSPAFGPVSGGTSVSITGSNFVSGDTSVTIGGVTVPATVSSSTSLTFNTPAVQTAGNVEVTVSTSGGTSSAIPGGFTYEDSPTATAISPSHGSSSGGTTVTVTGTNFTPQNTTVTIGGILVQASEVMVNSSTSLSFSTPAHAAGQVEVTVSTSGGSSTAIPDGFTYEDAPTATALNPAFGSKNGGTSVTITGTNFVVGDTSVTIGGASVAAVVNSSTSLTFVTPAHDPVNVAVTVTTSGGSTSPIPGGFTYEDVPDATSLTPAFGPSAGGTSVTITGSNFVIGDTTVTIGGTPVSASVSSANSLTFITPAHTAGNVAVTVSNSAGSSAAILGGFTYEDAPTATSLSPAFGASSGGTLVTITGSNFVVGDTRVTIGGSTVSASVSSDSSLTFTTPAHSAGNVAVTVSTSGGTSSPISGGFTYEDVPVTSSISPGFGPIAGGTSVTITGSNFVSGDTSVTIGVNIVPVVVNSSTSLTFTTPAVQNPGQVAVTVSTSAGISTGVSLNFTYEDVPTSTAISPAFGTTAGGTLVTVTGSHFVVGDTSVTIGAVTVPPASVTVISSTTLTFSTPAQTAGNVAVTVTTSGGTSTPIPNGFTYEDAPTATLLSPAFGSINGGTSVTITGTNFVIGDTTVTIDGVPVTPTVNSATSLTFTTPAHAEGNVEVTVMTSAGTTSGIPGGFTYEDTPTATSLSPAFGPSGGGTQVTITGTKFVANDTSVTIGGTVVAAVVSSSTSLTFTTPAHAAGNVAVTVSTSGGTSTAISGGFTYEDAPTATSLNPVIGPTAGGTLVTIAGSNFVSGDTSVTIGSTTISAASVTVNSANSLTFSTPAVGSAGNVSVTVTTSGGTSAAIPGGYTYNDSAATVSSLSPAFGPAAGGTLVTITGTNFISGNTTVTIGGTTIPATFISSTSISFSTPAHAAGNVGVFVTTPAGSTGLVPGGFTYEDVPTATVLNPSSGPIIGGTLVTITGSNFVSGDTTVTIGGTNVPATVSSSSSLTFTTPGVATPRNVGVTVSTSGGTTAAIPNGFTYTNSSSVLPTATSLSPAAGPTSSGNMVIITGTNFSGTTTVVIDGISAGATVISPTSLQFSAPPHAAGNVSVYVNTAGQNTNFVPGGYTYVDPPTATSISPSAGPSAGGTTITITGSNFVAGNTTVTIDTSDYPATVNSPTSLTVTTAAHAAGNVAVTVTTAGGTTAAIPGGFTYEDAPTAGSISPAFGSSGGGSSVTITGSNFVAGGTTVSIGGINIPASSVTVNSPTSLTFSIPAHAAGNVTVTVSTPGGTSVPISGGFTYEDAPTASALSPTAGPISGGTLVTITGTNFVSGDTTVTIDGTTVAATVNTASSLTFSTPDHAAVNVTVTVSTSGGTTAAIPGGFTYEDAPTASSLSPAFGPSAGGTSVSITGTNFVPGNTTVTIGGTTVAATVNTSSSLTFTTPAHAAGNVSVTVTTPGGTSAAISGGFTYEDAPTASSLSPAYGPIGGGTTVTITGTNFVPNDTTVTIGGTPVAAVVSSSTSLTFSTPAHAAVNVTVTVSTSGGTTAAIPGGFTYEDAPTASSLSPAFGPSAGGTSVTITGTNFVSGSLGNTTVTIGGTTVAATVNTSSSLTFTTPAHAAGNVSVTVTTPGGTSAAISGGFTYEDAPTASSLSPAYGPIGGGTLVTITGTNFVPNDTTVTIGGTPVAAVVSSSTSLTFSTPAHSAVNVTVTVSTSGGTTAAIPGGFTYEDAPTASSLSPAFGPSAGGTSVTITGTNFVSGSLGNTTVTIGGTTVAATVNTSTSLTFTTPAHAAGNVSVTVTTPGGTSAAISGGFTYEDAPTASSLSPAYGPIGGGTTVTITGTNFVPNDTTVTIGGTPVAAVVSSSTSLTFSTPAHSAVNVTVTVSTSGGTTAAIPGGFTYEDAPTASSLSPAFGPSAGGTSVTITGTNFVSGSLGNTTVTIGGTTVAATVNTSSSLTFTTPAHAAGNVSVTVTTPGGTSAAISGGFTYEDAPTASSLSPAYGPIGGGTTVTITGTNFVSGDTGVKIDGISAAATVISSTSLTFTTPAHSAVNVTVTVTTSGGTTPNIPGGFTYVSAPTAASISPSSGTTGGGTSVTITGTNFVAANTSVTIGGTTIPASSVTVNSSTSLTCSTPVHAAGNVAVNVTTPGGSSSNISGGYTYLAPSLTSCSAPIPSALGVQLLTCVGANLTLFNITFLKASGSAACSTFPTEQVLPQLNILGQVLITATNVPTILSQGLVGCKVQVCNDSLCSILGGVAGPVTVTLGL